MEGVLTYEGSTLGLVLGACMWLGVMALVFYLGYQVGCDREFWRWADRYDEDPADEDPLTDGKDQE